ILVDRNLGQRKSRRGGVEDHHLPGNWQLYFAAWLDPAVSKLSRLCAQLRYSRPNGCRGPGSDHAGRTTPCLPVVAYRFWNPCFAVPFPHVGAGGLRVGSRTSSNVACGSIKKIWAVRSVAPSHSSTPRRHASLGRSARRAPTWEHHL